MTNLLYKASIVTTPTAYGVGVLNSIKPAFSVSDTELVTNGDFSNGLTGWTSSTPPTLNADNTVTFDSASESLFQSISQATQITIGRRYRLTFDGTGKLRYRTGFAGSDGTIKEITLPFVVDILANSNTNRIQPYGSSLGTGIVKSISLKEITDADFDFTRTSSATRVNPDYLIQDVPYNLFAYSEDFSNSIYTKYQASISETTIQSPILGSYVESISNTNTGTTYSFISQNLSSYDKASTSTISVYAKKGTYNRIGLSNRSGDSFGVIYDLDNGTVIDANSSGGQILSSSIQSAANGFYLCSVTLDKSNQYNIHPLPSDVSNASLLLGTLNYAATGNILIFGAQVVKGTNLKTYLKTTDRLNIPRLDYTNGTASILLEPQSTNTVTYSENFDQYLLSLITTPIQSGFLAPDGTNTAYKITGVIGSSSVYLPSVTSTTATRSIWARTVSGTGTSNLMSYFSNTNNLFTITEQWQRFELTGSSATGSDNFYAIDFRDSQTLSEVIIWGAQSEELTYPTSSYQRQDKPGGVTRAPKP